MRRRACLAVLAIVAGALAGAPAGTAVAQGIDPSDSLEGFAVGAFNTHESQRIVRELPDQGVQDLWIRHGAPSVLFAAIDLAERNSQANFPAAGPYRAAVSTSADTVLAAGRGEFLLVLVVPWTDRFGEEPVVVTLNVTGALEPLELRGVPVASVYHAATSLTDLPPARPAAPVDGEDEEAEDDPGSVTEAAVRGLASGELALDAHFDPSLGLLWLLYLEGGPDGSPEEQEARRLCGEELAASHERIRAVLADLVERRDYDMAECSELLCVGHGMEWEPSLYVQFTRDEAGALRLTSIRIQSEALLGDEWFAGMEAWTAARMAELPATCAE